MKKLFLSLLGFLFLIFLSTSAQATLVYEQLPDPAGGGLPSNSGDIQVWDDFIPYSSGNINMITWWGISYGTPQFTYTFYGNNGNSPGSILYTSSGSPISEKVTITDADGHSVQIDMYSITLGTSFTAEAGTRYWLSISNTNTDSLWGWQIAPYGNGSIQGEARYDTNGNFLGYYDAGGILLDPVQPGGTSNVAFRLTPDTAPVPIPTAAWLLALGLIGLAVVRRRIRR